MTLSPKLAFTPANGITLASWEWRAALRGQSPTLLMVHASGFHGRVWDQVIHQLPNRHVVAVELRGHGRSEVADFDDWRPFGQDLAGFAEAMDLRGAVGIGHSMGAHALVQAAALQPSRFSQLVLVDPVMLAPADYHLPAPPPGTLHPAAGRKNRFESAQAMFERFADRRPYSVFDPQSLRDYCQHGLRPADDGVGFQLACAPRFEGKVYPLARQNPGIYASIRAANPGAGGSGPAARPVRPALGPAGLAHLAGAGGRVSPRPRLVAGRQDPLFADGRPGADGAADRGCCPRAAQRARSQAHGRRGLSRSGQSGRPQA